MCVSFVTSGFCLSVTSRIAFDTKKKKKMRRDKQSMRKFFQISLHDLCRRLLARLTSATKFVYFENRYHESSSRGAPLRTVALHAMYDTVHRALINRYTHRYIITVHRRCAVISLCVGVWE